MAEQSYTFLMKDLETDKKLNKIFIADYYLPVSEFALLVEGFLSIERERRLVWRNTVKDVRVTSFSVLPVELSLRNAVFWGGFQMT